MKLNNMTAMSLVTFVKIPAQFPNENIDMNYFLN
jgi:hypothetical protein